MSKKIVFKINKDGNVLIDNVEGYGSSCVEATELIEKALGRADESSRKFTDEYNEPVEQDNTERIRH
jgi:hypothetical protein